MASVFLLAQYGENCDTACECAGYGGCDAPLLESLNTSAAFFAAVAEYDPSISCTLGNQGGARGYGGAPFYKPKTPTESCYFWNGGAGTMDCSLPPAYGDFLPFCACTGTTTTTTSVAGGAWILGGVGETCNDACADRGYGLCGEDQMAYITNYCRFSEVMERELHRSCRAPNRQPSAVQPPINNANTPFYRIGDNTCRFLEGEAVDCTTTPTGYGQTRSLCYCLPPP
ncbi:unnamed protein product [Symbiodinium sp. CCMP2592]|nr:unnamed protein product [Symbiodinium sp. CCMP2592]